MENSLYILIPLSLLLVLAIALVLWWSVKSGQFDDLEGPGFRILIDEDTPAASQGNPAQASVQEPEGENKTLV